MSSTLETEAEALPLPLFVLVGAVFDDARRAAVRAGKSPSADVLELQNMTGAELFDFSWLAERERRELSTRLVCRALGRSWGLAWSALQNVRRPCAIYATGEDVGIPLAVALRLSGARDVLVGMRFENPDVGRTELKRRLFRSVLDFALGRLDLVFCRSRRHMAHLADRYGYRSTVLGREVNDVAFYDPERAPPRTEPVDGLELPESPYIVSAGLELRDYDTLLEAVRDLPIRVVIGAGSPWSHFDFDPRKGIPSNVRVAKFSPAQMRQLYAGAEFVVVPVRPTSRTCGISVVLEAFAMRKAVIVSRTGGLEDYVRDGENVLEVALQDPRDLRDKIERLLGDRELRERLARQGHQDVRRELSLLEYPRIVAGAIREQARARLAAWDFA